jgi:hypothetical protein
VPYLQEALQVLVEVLNLHQQEEVVHLEVLVLQTEEETKNIFFRKILTI